jgi:hypothetical protein
MEFLNLDKPLLVAFLLNFVNWIVKTNNVFAIIFLIEVIFKMMALSIMRYVHDPFNFFEGVVAVISIVLPLKLY